MKAIHFQLNDQPAQLQADPAMPLLWALRDHLGLKGCKPGCLQGVCGACTVHVDGAPVRSCQVPLAAVEGHIVTTIEGLAEPLRQRLLAAWTEHQALQCGYCQPGQAMTAAALLNATPAPDDAAVQTAMAGHLCRCGTSVRTLLAVRSALATTRGDRS